MTSTERRRLLIVDDEVEIRSTLAQYFGAMGYVVETARDVPEGLRKLSLGVDVVLSDIRLPGETGIELLQQARRANPRVGVFLITGYPTLDTMIDAKQFGAVALFRKPLRLAELHARIQAFVDEAAAGEPPPGGPAPARGA